MKAARRPLFWFSLVMWGLSVLICALLIQLGGLIMSDMPTAGDRISRADFIDVAARDNVQLQLDAAAAALVQNADDIEDAEFLRNTRRADYRNQRESFDNWLLTRSVTQSDAQNPEVLARVQAIDDLKLAERDAERDVDALRQNKIDLERSRQTLQSEMRDIEAAAVAPYAKARNAEVLKVFLIRLAVTLPLLLVSAWMIAKKRGSHYWPLYRGFVLFSLFAFFVELVPYMPSYGGYVRTIVGIALTLVAAHFAIKWMKTYVDKKQSEEQQPEADKRKLIAYETAVKKINACQCPSCDRSFGDPKARKEDTQKIDFCVHCGFGLFKKCSNCGTRDNSFYKFCGSCGIPSGVENG